VSRHVLRLFDIDGVLANEVHRQHHALNRDWAHYFHPSRLARDTVWPQGRDLYQLCLAAGDDVGYLTGRREDLREYTEAWLADNGFNATLPLIMRKLEHQTRAGYPLPVLKAGIVRELTYVYDEVWLYEDDPAVCEAVGQVQGARVHHCAWHIKPTKMVRFATA
jgi:phosphoglycolate phosphatase-like HAD superfamily hydrolase